VCPLDKSKPPRFNVHLIDYTGIFQFVEILKPFKDVTMKLSADKEVTISKVIPCLDSIFDHLKKRSNSPLAKSLLTEFNSRFGNFYSNELYSIATVLDPRFKGLLHISTGQLDFVKILLSDKFSYLLNSGIETAAPATSHSIPSDKDVFRTLPDFEANIRRKQILAQTTNVNANESPLENELNRYLAEPYIDITKCPLGWWGKEGSRFPLLLRCAKHILCIPATETSSERCFSTAGNVLTDVRSSLSNEHTEALVFLKENISILDMF
jgi:zinc finger BED domain-containing protein 1 (E3 SUMO-protein ligase ZBED1)